MRDYMTALIECSVTMSVLVLGFMAITPWLSKRYSAKWLYYVWLVLVLGLIIPFRVHPNTAFIRMNAAPSYIQQIVSGNAGNVVDLTIPTGTAPQGLPAISWYQIGICLWIAGVFVFIIYHGLKHYRFIRMVNRWGEQPDAQMLNTLQKIKTDMGITKPVKLWICSCISSPMMIGFLSPVILLPWPDFSANELPYILRHELVHFKRKDLWYKSLVLLATAIHWFNPVVYLMAKAIASQSEISCDAEVVNETDLDTRQRYSETIIGVIKNQSKMQTAFSTNFYGGKKGMKNRIYSIMDTTKKKTGTFILCLVFIGTLATGTVFASADSAADKNTKKLPIIKNTTSLVIDNGEGESKISLNGGKTWDKNESGQTNNNEWYTYNEYKAWLEAEKISIAELVKMGEWTQQKADEAIADYEKTLEDIKNGARISKPVKIKDDNGGIYALSLGRPANEPEPETIFRGTIKLDDGTVIDFGPSKTKEELISKLKAYCEKEIAAERMTQKQADKLLKAYK